MGTESRASYSAPLASRWRTLSASLCLGLGTVRNCLKNLLAFSPAEISHDLTELMATVWMPSEDTSTKRHASPLRSTVWYA